MRLFKQKSIVKNKYISPIGKGMFKQLKNESYKVYKVIAE